MASPAVVVTEFEEDTATQQEAAEEQEENDEVRALKYKEYPSLPGRHIISSWLSRSLIYTEYLRCALERGGGAALLFLVFTTSPNIYL